MSQFLVLHYVPAVAVFYSQNPEKIMLQRKIPGFVTRNKDTECPLAPIKTVVFWLENVLKFH